ncbi:Hsp20/alpha crystallin family protein [Candidatus Macondimonas diazotrophica]|jgi:HSP20 family molecular chaperone IbpA|nr:Hsp20/alpha crystallin family protein [Candidatus Macondimonas diazotrophica]
MWRDELNGWMWEEAQRLLEHAERLQRRFFQPAVGSAPMPCWAPPVDVVEVSGGVIIQVALPGVPSDAVQVHLEAGELCIRGERPLPAGVRQGRIHRLEIPFGRFERCIGLPPGSWILRPIELRDGCLSIRLMSATPVV